MKNNWINADILHNLKGEEKLNAVWNNIEYIKQELIEEKKKEKEEKENKKKNERTRKINVPLNMCKDISELMPWHEIDYTGFYETFIDNKYYIFDIYKTTDMKFFVSIVDVTDDGYELINFYDFKKKYAQPNLFDYFDI